MWHKYLHVVRFGALSNFNKGYLQKKGNNVIYPHSHTVASPFDLRALSDTIKCRRGRSLLAPKKGENQFKTLLYFYGHLALSLAKLRIVPVN